MASADGGRAAEIPEQDAATFLDFIRRVRSGDEAAATELVSRYEPALRLEIRLRLLDARLRRLLDPADVCQSVLKSFFVRATTGQFELDSPQKLMALLRTMARNKVAHQARKQKARAAKEQTAEQNRFLSGRSKAEKLRDRQSPVALKIEPLS